MKSGAAAAYDRIDEKVTANLIAACNVLKRLKDEAQQQSKTETDTDASLIRKPVTITDYSVSSDEVSKKSRKNKSIFPKSIIRHPDDMISDKTTKNSMVKKILTDHDSLSFPDAYLRSKNLIEKRGSACLEHLDNFKEIKSNAPRSEDPDTLFPTASYHPCNNKTEECLSKDYLHSSLVPDVNIFKSTEVIKDKKNKENLDLLDNCTEFKSKQKQNRVPDNLFPKAKYLKPKKGQKIIANSSESTETGDNFNTQQSEETKKETTSSCSVSASIPDDTLSSSNFPMTFFSSDGKMKMMLTKNENQKGITTGIIVPVSTSDKKSPSIEADIFPPVPKQLSSFRNINGSRHKFNARMNIGPHSVEISGLYNTKVFDAKTVDKVIINGISYKVN